jgi:hypothetical protein
MTSNLFASADRAILGARQASDKSPLIADERHLCSPMPS